MWNNMIKLMSDPTQILKSHQRLQKTMPTFGLGLYVRAV